MFDYYLAAWGRRASRAYRRAGQASPGRTATSCKRDEVGERERSALGVGGLLVDRRNVIGFRQDIGPHGPPRTACASRCASPAAASAATA